jgi:hypothetical protein
MRRAGMFACGSLATALLELATELGTSFDAYLYERDGLARLCTDEAIVADLVRLAIRSEFAEVRWMPGSPTERRRSEGSLRPLR